MSNADLNAAASVTPPVSEVDTIILASATSSARLKIPTDWLKAWLTIEADGCDCYHAFSTDATQTVSETAVTTLASEAVSAHGTGECVPANDGVPKHYDLRLLAPKSADEFWFFVHKESAASAFVRLTRSSGPAARD